MSRLDPKFLPPKYLERNAARRLFGQGLADVEIARRVGASPRSVGRWRKTYEAGSDPWPGRATSFGEITDATKRLRNRREEI